MATLDISPESKQHKIILDQLTPRIKMSDRKNTDQHEKWRKAEERIIAYVPQNALDSKRSTRRDNGKPQYTTLQLPYTYALVMSAHTYLTSVFFARAPVHQFAGRHGEAEQQIQAVEALIDYQVGVGGALGPYYIWLYDGLKYGLGVTGEYWCKEEIQLSSITVDPQSGKKVLTTRRGIGFEGNKIYNVSPFDFLPDPRVPVGKFQSGEYCGARRRISWNDIIRRKAQGYYTNVEKLRTQVGTSDPQQDSYSALNRPDSSPSGYGNIGKHPAIVEVYEVYIELIPSEWSLGESNFPEKWVFTITKDFSLVIGAEPYGHMHNKFPFNVLETEIEAYGLFNRGVPEIIEPLQDTMDWLVNSHFYNVRAVLNNLFIADPTKVVMKDLENGEPGGIIRLKPEAYGSDLRTFFQQIPMQDITQSHINDVGLIQAFGERALGVNDQIMGALAGGGRKTATEVRTSTGFGVNRLKTITEYISATSFSEHAQKLIANSQQFYTGEKKFRIVGSLGIEAGSKFVNVTPEDIMGQYDMVPVDGVLPVDRMAQANLWKEILLNVGRVPQIMMQYDIGRIFAWMASIAGLKNINQFKVQVLPPGAGPTPGAVPLSAAMLPGSQPPPRMPQSAPQDTGLGGI